MHRRQQPKEQFHVSDTMDPGDLDCRVMWAYSYEALPPSSGSLWSAVMPRPPRPSWTQSVPSSDVIDIDEGCQITNALQEHPLPLHQVILVKGVVNPSDPRHLQPLISPCEMNATHPSSSSLRISSRSAYMLAPTFIQNPKHVNASVSQHCEGAKEQHQSARTRLDVQVAFIDDYPRKTSELLDREAPKGSNNVSQVGISAVLAKKVGNTSPSGCTESAELSTAMQRSLEASVYGGIAVDKSQL